MNNTSNNDKCISVDKLKSCKNGSSKLFDSGDSITGNSMHVLDYRKNSSAKPKQKQEDLVHISKTPPHKICLNCFENKNQCICHRIQGYDPNTGYPIVSITEEEWDYIHHNSKVLNER